MDSSTPFRLPRKTPFGIGENVTEWATGLSQLDKFYAQRPVNTDTKTFLRFTLDILGIDYRIAHGSLDSVPKQGATVIVANHPLGCVEGVILAELLLMVRDDIQILANQYLKTVPELDQLFIGVDVFEGKDAVKSNMKALRAANKHLANGGLLLVFPAGEVSKLVDAKQQRLEDKEWSRSVSALIRKNKAATVPVFIRGQNSKRFYMAGKIHPLLRTLMLGRELLNKSAKTIELSFGQAIKFKELNNLNDDQIVNYLRLNTYLLNRDVSATQQTVSDNDLLPIAAGLPIGQLLEELHSLPAETQLLQSGEFDVYCASAHQIPSLLHEIGRLREHNFRQVGEGTGQAIDIDHFDHDYLHLFVWDRENQCMVGAYRLGLVDQLLAKYGVEGLYSRTLFNYDQRFLDQMGKSIEMGRSVIAEQYQKSMSALLLLWKGIATFVHQHPEYTHLFGPVSISNDYSHTARQLLAQSMTLHHYDNDCAEYVTPSNPLPETNLNWNTSMLTALGDLQLLSRVIARIDEGKGVPVLLRQYLSLNGKLVCFNVDPAFNNALDGLIMVDLRDVPEKTLARYMGSENAREYLAMNN
ncbi:lysophospholipid acyltransferase family protein [Vibrio parahaemolyticus]|uniref:lysophospholipid acyltransferase family protein n=1 Tax=Vibrio parahaemolyticus TaxID=670 RepID=UPI000BE3914D|nr:GNAT family N-acyltransferase [Vibrio parahaemolyticus]ATI46340.1 hemolysin [Vibrio parahaemolyticus]EJI1397288.1 lysophospholipid acyltransferase family protein [Vibrio parahaemolyticus]EKN4665446.1 lysophospholipid acyltransferase family protein [Vibrio parahaemolyticus]MCX8937164.1 lysophospholipid acyltransferase family protein [Vibrio parahaemolyticus]TBT85595.1 lysophospholipid acyltransferase family protein [Vibrio parahaemolyticus]